MNDDEFPNIYSGDDEDDEAEERFMDEFGNLIDPDEVIVSDEDPLLAADDEDDEPLPLDLPLAEEPHTEDPLEGEGE